jgi:hypothetical protein
MIIWDPWDYIIPGPGPGPGPDVDPDPFGRRIFIID